MGLTPSLSRPQVATEEYCWLGGLVIYFHYQCHVTGILKTQSLFLNFYTALVLIKKRFRNAIISLRSLLLKSLKWTFPLPINILSEV